MAPVSKVEPLNSAVGPRGSLSEGEVIIQRDKILKREKFHSVFTVTISWYITVVMCQMIFK